MSKIKNWAIFILSLIAGAFGLYLLSENDKEKLHEANEKIKKAGEQYEAEHFDNADSAAQYIDDVLGSIDGKNGD